MNRYTEVYCSLCACKHFSEEVEFLDIEEDFYGRDMMTFRCKESGEDSEPQKSIVVRAPY